MGRLLGLVLLAGAMTMMGSALAQSPMSPIYPTSPAKPRQARPPITEIAPAPDHEPSKAPHTSQSSPVEEPPIATAVIPPPVEKAQPESAEPKKPATAEAKQAQAIPEPHHAVKHHKRTARHYAVYRLYAPYPVGWYTGSAGTRGWGGGQFGPSPYSSNGQ